MSARPPPLLDVALRSDPEARRATKDETVDVTFAGAPGAVTSEVGANRYSVGDALLRGATGDTWSVARATFDAKYDALPGTTPGSAGRYRNRPSIVYAKRMSTAFSIVRRPSGDRLDGAAGDWLVEYAPGDHGIVAAARFAAVYRLIES
jgi:hypothetical protein